MPEHSETDEDIFLSWNIDFVRYVVQIERSINHIEGVLHSSIENHWNSWDLLDWYIKLNIVNILHLCIIIE